MSEAEILDDFPYLKKEDIQAAVLYAAHLGRAALSEA
jgi:uncharacterized protein (DUF433 family)